MRGPGLTPSATIRLGIFAALALGITAFAMLFGHAPDESSVLAHSPFSEGDPLAQELARCSGLGVDAEHDQTCKGAWAENCRRLFTYRAVRAASEVNPAQPANAPPEEK